MLLRSVMTTGAGIFSAVILGAITTKIVALLAGPGGLALYGQLRQIGAMLTNVVTVNGGPSLVHGLASADDRERPNLLISVVAVTTCTGCVMVLATLLMAPSVEQWLFSDAAVDMTMTLRVLALVALAGAGSSLIANTLTGLQHFKRLAVLQIAGAAASAAISYPALTYYGGNQIALIIILGANPFTVVMVAIALFLRAGSADWGRGRVSRNHMLGHLRFSLPLLLVGIMQVGVPIFTRAFYIDRWGLETAGWFEASYILGSAYVGLFLQAITTVYLPGLSRETTATGRSKVIGEAFRLALGISAVLITFGFVTRSYLLVLFFSDTFLPARSILWWMLAHDLIKVVAWCFSTLLLSVRDIRAHFTIELMTSAGFVVLVGMYIDQTIEIAGIAYFIMAVLQATILCLYAYWRYGIRLPRRSMLTGVASGLMVAIFAAMSSRSAQSNQVDVAIWAVTSVCFLFLVSSAIDRRQVYEWGRSILPLR